MLRQKRSLSTQAPSETAPDELYANAQPGLGSMGAAKIRSIARLDAVAAAR
jgi:hypothetical protein